MAVTHQAVAGMRQLRDNRDENAAPTGLDSIELVSVMTITPPAGRRSYEAPAAPSHHARRRRRRRVQPHERDLHGRVRRPRLVQLHPRRQWGRLTEPALLPEAESVARDSGLGVRDSGATSAEPRAMGGLSFPFARRASLSS